MAALSISPLAGNSLISNNTIIADSQERRLSLRKRCRRVLAAVRGIKQCAQQRNLTGVRRSPCSVANALYIIGDKWTLLLESPEDIPTKASACQFRQAR